MNLEEKWKAALIKAGVKFDDSAENIYVPASERRSVKLFIDSRPDYNRADAYEKPYTLKALIKHPNKTESWINIVGVTDLAFKTKKEAIDFQKYIVENQPIASLTFKRRVMTDKLRRTLAEGGRVTIVNEGVEFDKNKYQAIFDDYDNDGIPNIDDAEPLKKSKTPKRVESISLEKTFSNLLELKKDLDETMNAAVEKLDEFSPEGSKIYARTKTPFSIVKKLVDKRLLDKNRGLTDLVGTTIATDDYADLKTVRDAIRKGELGEVLEEEDMYKSPKAGYRAYHFIVEMNETPIEIQLKTKRMKAVNELSHGAYKKGTLNVPFLEELTKLVAKADKGEQAAIKKADEWLSDKKKLEKKLDLSYEN
jgi:ppGpp synthetase/RelA/SpoT-type nucleotidyltranferase